MAVHARAGRAVSTIVRLALGLALLCVPASPVYAADALLYRLFLHDGSTVVSYGDFTRVDDRVVFSIPIGNIDAPTPALHVVSLSEAAIDWERTDRYAEAVRSRQYAATQGEADFDQLSAEVARALYEVATVKEPERRLALAVDARRRLAAWPARHHGYRAGDVAQLSSLLDEAISELRVSAGQSRFDLELVATAAPLPPDEPALPPPTLRESIEQAFKVASVTNEPAERVSLLEAIVGNLKDTNTNATWVAALSAKASSELLAERRTDKAYQDLTNRMVMQADARARRADVSGIDALIKAVLRADDKLGRVRPQMTAALLATLDGRLDSARRLRLARDAWSIRQRGVEDYLRKIRSSLDRLRRSAAELEQIRQLSGPPPAALNPLAKRVLDAYRDLKVMRAPPEVETAHGVLTGAAELAARAAAARRLAVTANDMGAAWEASSAAAGALLMLDRAQQELQKVMTPPTLDADPGRGSRG
jgi:hypothetical protein